MPRINQVLLVPDVTNKSSGKFSEQEMIQGYVQSLLEHLEDDRVIVSMHRPGEIVMPHTLVIHCRGGFLHKIGCAKSNTTAITYGSDDSADIAALMQMSINEWGRSYADFYHRSALPKQDPTDSIINSETTIGVGISPFKVNGPAADSYMSRLDQLGKAIAHCVHEFMATRSELTKVGKVDYKPTA